MRYLIILILALASAVGTAQAVGHVKTLGTTTVTNADPIHYGDTLHIEWTWTVNPKLPILGIECRQHDQWVYVAELGYPVKGYTSLDFPLINENCASSWPGLDYTIPASCVAFTWDEGSLNGRKYPIVLTQADSFTAYPQ